MQKASFWYLILSLLLTKPVSQITYRDTIADAGNMMENISIEYLRRN